MSPSVVDVLGPSVLALAVFERVELDDEVEGWLREAADRASERAGS